MDSKELWGIEEEETKLSITPDNQNYDRLTWEEQINNMKANRGHRAKLVSWVKWNVTGWLVCVILIVAFCGFGWMRLDSIVLTTLLATTTVNILGLAFIVLKGLFNYRRVDN